MTRKVLVISQYDTLKDSFLNMFLRNGIKAVSASHDEALNVFFSESPTHVFIGECERGNDTEKTLVGFRTYADIKNSADDEVRVFALGISPHEDDDYIQMPITQEEFIRIVTGKA